jgi:hypothetical protein
LMRPVEFGEAVPAGTRLILFSDDKPDLLFTVITFWIDKVSGVALVLETGVPATKSKTRKAEFIYFFNSQSGRTMKNRWVLWRPDQAGFDSRSIFEGALVDGQRSRSDGAVECWITAPSDRNIGTIPGLTRDQIAPELVLRVRRKTSRRGRIKIGYFCIV